MPPLCGRTLLGIALASTALWACQFDTQGYTPWDVPGPDAAPLPDALADAGEPNDGGTGCTNGDQRCLGTAVQLCVDGLWIESSVCDWGCNYSPQSYPYCGTPLWAETVNPITDVGTGVWVADMGTTVINTDDGTITTPTGPLTADFVVRTHFRSGGLEPVTIIGFTEITIPEGARVEVEGTRALALVAYNSIVIGGELMAQGLSNGDPGPGGYPGGVNGGPGEAAGGGAPGAKDGSAILKSGAGGGGYTGLGGDGGTVSQLLGTVVGGPGGSTSTVDPVDGPLVGGHGGGATAGDIIGTNMASGGGGGGALMLAAQLSVEVLATGVVNAGGGGGASRGAGAGGGSGGMVLIQTHTCVVAGVVAANGGGGGAVENGAPGPAGSSGDQPTPGGGTHGGTGGAGSGLDGGGGTANDNNGGGGGGGAGFIRIDSVQPPLINMGIISPHENTAGHAQNAFPTT